MNAGPTRRSLAAIAAALLAQGSGLAAAAPEILEDAPLASSVALLAALYGLPLIGMQERLNREALDPATRLAPFDSFHRYAELSTPERAPFRAPNVDTLYATAWLDLRDGPVILAAPPTGARFWNAQALDFATDTFANIGQARFGAGPGRFALVGPGWSGEAPAGVRATVRSPTVFALILLRVLVDGPADLAAAAAVQAGFALERTGAALPPPAPLPLGGAQERFAALGVLLERDPVRPGEQALREQFALIGVGPAQVATRLAAPPALLEVAQTQAQDAARQAGVSLGRIVSGWRVIDRDIGTYGFDYLRRAAVWVGGPLANTPEESLYPSATVDAAGQELDGRNRYVLRFPPGGLPPAGAFWSLTIYDRATGMLVANPIDRYAIGNRTPGLVFGPDGALDILIQHDRPAEAANWLPAPAGRFYLTLRLYRPERAALDGRWRPPAVEPVA